MEEESIRHTTRKRKQRVIHNVDDGKQHVAARYSDQQDTSDDESREESEEEEEEEEAPKPRRRASGAGGRRAAASRKPTPRRKVRKEDDAGSESDAADDGDEDEEPKQKSAKAKKGKGKGGHKNTGDEGGASSTLFQAVRRSAALSAVAADWVSRYHKDERAAMEELLSFLLLCAGATRCHTPPGGMATSDMGEEDWTELLEGFFEDVAETGATFGPLAHSAKGKATKASLRFHDNFCELWHRIGEASKSSNGVYEGALLDAVINLLSTISSARYSVLRLTATLAACELMTATVEARAQLTTKLETTEQQLKASQARGAEASSKTAVLELQQERLQMAVKALEEASDAVVNGVWVHRYRDVSEAVRVECIRALGAWMKELPAIFARDQFIKYMGWLLNDKGAGVRMAVVQGLRDVYSNESLHSRLEAFTARFRPAMVRMCMDVDGEVAQGAAQLLRVAYDGGLLEDMPEEEREEVVSAVFEPTLPEPTRSEALAFVLDQLAAFDEKEAAGAAKAAEKRGGASAVAAHEQCYAMAQIEALLQIVTAQANALQGEEAEEAEEAAGVNSRGEEDKAARLRLVELLVEALWPLPAAKSLRNWGALCDLLERDVGDASGAPLEDNELLALAKLMLTTASRLKAEAADGDGLKGKEADGRRRRSSVGGGSGKDARRAAQEALGAMTETLLRRLSPILVKFGGDESKVFLLAQLPQYMSPQTLAVVTNKAGLSMLLQRLREAYLRSESDETLAAVAASFRALSSGKHGRAGDVKAASSTLLIDIASQVMTAGAGKPNAAEQGVGAALASAAAARDEEFSLALSMRRLRHLLAQVDPKGPVDANELWRAVLGAVEERCDFDSPAYTLLQASSAAATTAEAEEEDADNAAAAAAGTEGMASASAVASQGLEALLVLFLWNVRHQLDAVRARGQRRGRRGGRGGGKEKGDAADEGDDQEGDEGKEAEKEEQMTDGSEKEEESEVDDEGGAASSGKKRKRGGAKGTKAKKSRKLQKKPEGGGEQEGGESGGSDTDDNGLETDEEDDAINNSVNASEQLRDELVTDLRAALSMHLAMVVPSPSSAASGGASSAVATRRDLSAGEQRAVDAVQRSAFVCCNVLRNVVSQSSLSGVPYLRRLVWRPDDHMCGLLQHYFDSQEESLAKDEVASEDGEREGAMKKPVNSALSKQVRQLLLPMLRGLWGSAEVLQKRQAADAVMFFVGAGEQASELVRAFTSKLKNYNPVRYLEVQMATLRVAYGKLVRAAGAKANDDLMDDEALQHVVAAGRRRWVALAQRLAQSLGVGHLKGRELQGSFVRFMREGVRFSLEEAPKRFDFLECMMPYLGKLSPTQKKALVEYLEEKVAEFPEEVEVDVETYQERMHGKRKPADDDDEDDEDSVPIGYQAFFAFQGALTGTGHTRRARGGGGGGKGRAGQEGGARRKGRRSPKENKDEEEEESSEQGENDDSDANVAAAAEGEEEAVAAAASAGSGASVRKTPQADRSAVAVGRSGSGSGSGSGSAHGRQATTNGSASIASSSSLRGRATPAGGAAAATPASDTPRGTQSSFGEATQPNEDDDDMEDEPPLLPSLEDDVDEEGPLLPPLPNESDGSGSEGEEEAAAAGGSVRKAAAGSAGKGYGKATARYSRSSSRFSGGSELFLVAEAPEGGSDGEGEEKGEGGARVAGKRKRGGLEPGEEEEGREEEDESDDDGMFEELGPSAKKGRA